MERSVLMIASLLLSFFSPSVLASPLVSYDPSLNTSNHTTFDFRLLLLSGLGIYTFSLGFGTNLQTVFFVMSTAISFVWSPCQPNFNSFLPIITNRVNHVNINTIFDPRLSSTWNNLKCNDSRCWLPDTPLREKNSCDRTCNSSGSQTCLQGCPTYDFDFGKWSSGGTLLFETLYVGDSFMPDFLFGCSHYSTNSLIGIVGLGRGSASLLSQMGIKKFSYCFSIGNTRVLSRFRRGRIDPNINDSYNDHDLKFINFRRSTSTSSMSYTFYAVILRHIVIGNVSVKIPKNLLVQGPDGSGGTILDTGEYPTLMNRKMFTVVAQEFVNQIGRDKVVSDIDSLGLCFQGLDRESLPKMVFGFEGGVDLEFYVDNYFATERGGGVFCLAIVANDGGPNYRPAVVWGSRLQQDFYMVYDLEHNRLGFRRQKCARKMILRMQK